MATAAITGTAVRTNESGIVAGGKTIIITLTGDTFVSGAGFDNNRQTLIDHIVANGSPTAGWNNQVNPSLQVTDVVRTSNTVVTITMSAAANYSITSTEQVYVTVPDEILTGLADISAIPPVVVVPDTIAGRSRNNTRDRQR